MNIVFHSFRQFVVLATSALLVIGLSACGGGGDGGTPYQPSAPAAITADNSEQVAATALEQDSTIATTIDSIPAALPSTDSNTALATDLVGFVKFLENTVVRRNNTTTTSFTTLNGVQAACANEGGTVNAPDNGATNGTFTFKNCELIFGSGIIFDGSFTVSGTSGTNSVSASMTFNSFSISDSVNVLFTLNGSMSLNYSNNNGTESGKITIPLLTITIPADTITISSYSMTYVDYPSPANEEHYTMNYTVESSFFGGSFKLETIETIIQSSSDPFPYAGQVVITGANNSKVRVTADGDGSANGNVIIDTDADGDGTYETQVIKTWHEFSLLV